jgi:hypothetical protein
MRKADTFEEGAYRTGWRDTWKRSWKMFIDALPLLLLWLLLPMLIVIMTLGVQSLEPFIRPARFPARPDTLSFPLDSGDTLVLNVAAPQVVSPDSEARFSQTASIQASLASNPTISKTVIISIASRDGELTFLDEDGHLLPQPRTWILSTGPSSEPIRFFLLVNSVQGQRTALLDVVLLEAPGHSSGSVEKTIKVTIENPLLAWLFRALGSEEGITAVAFALISSLAAFGIQQWKILSADQKEKEKLRSEMRQDALDMIETLKKLLRARQFEKAKDHYLELSSEEDGLWHQGLIRERLESAWGESAPEDLRVWTLVEQDGVDATMAKKLRGRVGVVDESAVIRAISWAYNHLPSARKTAPQILADALIREAITVTAVEEMLGKTPGGLRLLRHPDIYQPLVRLAEDATGDSWESTCRLLAQRRGPRPWESTWPRKRPPPSKEVKRGMRALGLERNPFGPERAELDSDLHEYLARPEFWKTISGSRSVIAFGPAGSGKTAAALGLAHDCEFPPASPREEGTFAVYHVPRLLKPADISGPSPLDQIAFALGEALLQAFVQDPLLLLEQERDAKRAIARLLLIYVGFGSPQKAIWELERSRRELLMARGTDVLPKAPFQQSMVAELRDLTQEISASAWPEGPDLTEWMGRARPARCTRTYILIDLGLELDESAPSHRYLVETIDALMEDAVHFERYHVYLKAFLPQRLYEIGGDDWPVEAVEVAWEERDLRQMLKDRLAYAGQTSLAEIYRDPADSLPDPDGRLIEAADGLPRNLIRLGNEMLRRVDRAPLRPEHLPSRSRRK